MSEIQGHVFSYKLPDGTWVNIPVLVQDMYDTYVQSCVNAGVDYVSKEIYLQKLVDVVRLAELTGTEGVVPIENGGTGATDAESARVNLEVYSEYETDREIDMAIQPLIARLNVLEQETAELFDICQTLTQTISGINLKDLGIEVGTDVNNASATAKIYFEHD